MVKKIKKLNKDEIYILNFYNYLSDYEKYLIDYEKYLEDKRKLYDNINIVRYTFYQKVWSKNLNVF